MAKTNVTKGLDAGSLSRWCQHFRRSFKVQMEAAASSGTNVPAYRNVSKCKAIRDFIPTQVS
jgi:hypothetical protein